MNNTIFDDVFRTMVEKIPQLAVPLINEVFQTSYPEDVEIIQLRNEHHQENGEIITDSCLRIGRKLYHIECQSVDDTTMAIRMIEYDFAIALDSARKYGRRYRIPTVKLDEYTKDKIDEALALGETEGRRLIPSRDVSGHGTAVLGIAAGNGTVSEGVNRGVAYESEILVVKMGNAGTNSFPRTTELMEGIDYLVRQAAALGKPIAINISFGNNYGSHEPYN